MHQNVPAMYYYSIGMYVYVCVCILLQLECIQPDMEISEPSLVHMLQDYAFFIPPPQFYAGKRSRFSPSLDECWYGRVALLFRVHVSWYVLSRIEKQYIPIHTKTTLRLA